MIFKSIFITHKATLMICGALFCFSTVSSSQLHARDGYTEILLAEYRGVRVILESPSGASPHYSKYLSPARSLAQTFWKKVSPKVPSTLNDVLLQQGTVFRVRENLPFDGLFLGGVEDEGAFPDLVRPDLRGSLSVLLNANKLLSEDLLQTAVHEWFHAVHFHLRPNEPAWLREGMATLFEWLVGDVSRPISIFPYSYLISGMKEVSAPLEVEYDLRNLKLVHYAHSMFYLYYLYQQCGGMELFWKIARSDSPVLGRGTIEHALSSMRLAQTETIGTNSACAGFLESVKHFEIARIHNETLYLPSGRPSRVFRLLPPGNWPKADEYVGPLKLSDRLDSLQKLEPLVVSRENVPKLSLKTASIRIFALQSHYPYEVREVPLKNLKEKPMKDWVPGDFPRVIFLRVE
jgi:hypothetical protein